MKRAPKGSGNKWMIAMVIVAVLTCIACSWVLRRPREEAKWDPNEQTSKSMRFEAVCVNQGLVPVGSIQRAVFRFRNVSNRPIEVKTVAKSCSCMGEVTFCRDPIAPGTESVIEANYRPGEGKRRTQLGVTLDNEETQMLYVYTEGYYDVKLPVDRIDFPPATQTAGNRQSVIVYGDKDLFDIGSIEIAGRTPDWLEAKVGELKDQSGVSILPLAFERYRESRLRPMARVELVIKPGAPLGRFLEPVGIRVSGRGGEQRELILECRGDIVNEVTANPSRVILTQSQTGNWELITVRSINEPFRIVSVSAESLLCDYNDVPTSSFASQIRVKLGDGKVRGRDHIIVRLEHPTVQQIDIPVLCVGGSL